MHLSTMCPVSSYPNLYSNSFINWGNYFLDILYFILRSALFSICLLDIHVSCKVKKEFLLVSFPNFYQKVPIFYFHQKYLKYEPNSRTLRIHTPQTYLWRLENVFNPLHLLYLKSSCKPKIGAWRSFKTNKNVGIPPKIQVKYMYFFILCFGYQIRIKGWKSWFPKIFM